MQHGINITTNEQSPETQLRLTLYRPPFAPLSCPHLKALYGSPTPPPVQRVDRDKDEDKAEESRQGLAYNCPFRLR